MDTQDTTNEPTVADAIALAAKSAHAYAVWSDLRKRREPFSRSGTEEAWLRQATRLRHDAALALVVALSRRRHRDGEWSPYGAHGPAPDEVREFGERMTLAARSLPALAAVYDLPLFDVDAAQRALWQEFPPTARVTLNGDPVEWLDDSDSLGGWVDDDDPDGDGAGIGFDPAAALDMDTTEGDTDR